MHLASIIISYALPIQLTQTRLIHGTWKVSLIAASFQTWRGSWVFIAWDPIINITYIGQTIQDKNLSKEFNPAIADCRLQGTANSPSSMTMAERRGFEPLIELPLYTLSRRAPSTTRTSLHNLRNINDLLLKSNSILTLYHIILT